MDRKDRIRAVVLAAEQRAGLDLRNFVLELRQVTGEVRANVLSLFGEFQ
jgi:hypothetical protein